MVKFGLHYSFQSTDGNWRETYRNSFDQITLAEKYGFKFVTVAEHHFMRDGWIPSPMLACASIAMVTKNMKIGTNVTLLPFNNPVRAAEDLVVLDNISNGRAILGLGLGSSRKEYETFGMSPRERGKQLDEGLEVIKILLEKEKATHNGNYYNVRDLSLTPRPVQVPRPPIWIGATQEPAIARAAAKGDAWVATQMMSSKVLKQKMEFYEQCMRAAGKSLTGVERPLRREAYVASDGDQAWEDAKEAVVYEYGDVYLQLGQVLDANGKKITAGKDNFEEHLETLREIFMICDPDTFIAKVEECKKTAHTTLLLLRMQLPKMPDGKVRNSIKLIGEKVIPYFKGDDD